MKTLLLSLLLSLSLTCQVWAQSASPASPPKAAKTTPIIDVVAVVPAPDNPTRVKPSPAWVQPDLKADPLLGRGGLGGLDLGGQQAAGPQVAWGPLSAQPVDKSDTGLDFRLLDPGGWTAGASPLASLPGVDGRPGDLGQQGGFLAFRLQTSLLGDVILGGGFNRSYSASSSGSAPKGTLAAVRGPESTTYEGAGRWGAYMAVPYQITRNLGLRPEVSYYAGDMPEVGRDSANEWVMGLRFTFGF